MTTTPNIKLGGDMITVNLYDCTFGDNPCSVWNQTSKHIRYVRGLKDWSGITFYVDGFINNGTVDQVRSRYNIGWLHEVQCLWPHTYTQSINNIDKFDMILTYSKDLLALSSKYVYAPYAGTWIDKKYWAIHEKDEMVSMLFGAKIQTEGHKLRHKIWERIPRYPNLHYYGYAGTPTNYSMDTKLQVLKDYRFSIVIESCKQDGLWTEILQDCFALGTIPIFYGASDIGNYFDARAIITFDTVEELVSILPELSDGLYRKLLSYAKVNLRLMQDYAVTEDFIYNNILKDIFLGDLYGINDRQSYGIDR